MSVQDKATVATVGRVCCMVTPRIFLLAAFSYVLSGIAVAAPVFVPDTAGVVGRVFVPVGELGNVAAYAFDLRGNVAGAALDFPSFTGLGPMIVGDNLGGPPPALGNLSLAFLNLAFTEGLVATFNPAGTSTFAGTQWEFFGTATLLTPLTDPALVQFNSNFLFARFQLTAVDLLAAGTLYTYGLDFFAAPDVVAVPEPLSVLLGGAGLLAVGLLRRYRQTR